MGKATEYTRVAVDKLIPYVNNAKQHSDGQVTKIASSIREFGFLNPILIDASYNVIAGHGRILAAKKLQMDEVPCLFVEGLTEAQRKAYILADNRLSELAEWDDELLQGEMEWLQEAGFDMADFGFETEEPEKTPERKYQDGKKGVLASNFVAPPFSILDSRQGYWRARKAEWHDILPDSRRGRAEELLGRGLKSLAQNTGFMTATGTSEFDPVLCEIIYQWFCPPCGKAIDPFAGGHIRGTIADVLGLQYTGIELRQEQVDANNEIKAECGIASAEWICDDSLNVSKYIKDETADLILACPPYADLEVYSDDPRDISNMDYGDFLKTYTEIIKRFIPKLKQNRFAVFVVGDVRDEQGFYRDFISDTKRAFIENGMKLYNEIVLIEAGATAAMRAGAFKATRKTVKMHQNVLVFYNGELEAMDKRVLVFYKGNPKEIKNLDLSNEPLFSPSEDKTTKTAVKEIVAAATRCADTEEVIGY